MSRTTLCTVTAVECLQNGSGDAPAKSRLLVALCRNRGIPARLVTGLPLKKGHEQTAHVWAEACVLDHYHLLQVPRMAFLLSLVVVVLITAIVTANYQDLPATKYISLFPMVILTGMIERFWTLDVEDGTASSFQTLLGTMLIAATI